MAAVLGTMPLKFEAPLETMSMVPPRTPLIMAASLPNWLAGKMVISTSPLVRCLTNSASFMAAACWPSVVFTACPIFRLNLAANAAEPMLAIKQATRMREIFMVESPVVLTWLIKINRLAVHIHLR